MRPVVKPLQYTAKPLLSKLQSKEAKIIAGFTGIISGLTIFVPLFGSAAKDSPSAPAAASSSNSFPHHSESLPDEDAFEPISVTHHNEERILTHEFCTEFLSHFSSDILLENIRFQYHMALLLLTRIAQSPLLIGGLTTVVLASVTLASPQIQIGGSPKKQEIIQQQHQQRLLANDSLRRISYNV
ncbi:hypothetical protein HDU79_000616 [Rhizoclosmatium sp. JEL0117]|nr:hypothetical protein HDU79_000616 [Rhizoclosmatium sp. JEL0117]